MGTHRDLSFVSASSTNDASILETIASARESFKNSQYELASSLYQEALVKAVNLYGESNHLVAEIHRNLASASMMKGDYNMARPHFYRSLEIAELLSQQFPNSDRNSVLLTRSLGAIATFLMNQGSIEEAEPVCLKCLSLAERTYGMDHYKLVEPLRAISHLREKQGRYEESARHLKRAYVVICNVRGLVHPESQRLLAELLRVLHLQEDLRSVETYLTLNLEHWKHFGPSANDTSVACAAVKLAKLYIDTERSMKAEPLLLAALTIQEEFFGPDHSEVGETIHLLATCYYKIGRYDGETEGYFHRALEIFEHVYGHESPQVESYDMTRIINNCMILSMLLFCFLKKQYLTNFGLVS